MAIRWANVSADAAERIAWEIRTQLHREAEVEVQGTRYRLRTGPYDETRWMPAQDLVVYLRGYRDALR